MRNIFKNQSGYVALISILVVGAASTAIALTLLVTGTDSQRSAITTQQSAQARNLAKACMDEALQVIHDNTGYTGTGNLTLGQGTCSYTVTNPGGSVRNINVSGTVQNVVRKIQASVTIGSSISITSWQEVV